MADIELVIKIPEEEYDLIVNDEACGLNVLTRAIANGIPLPKGHGRLIDADAFAVALKRISEKQGYSELYMNVDDVLNAVIDDLQGKALYGYENCPTVEAIPKADYENRLKADMVAMFIELKNKLIDKSWNIDMYDDDLDFECCYLTDIDEIIQQKIDALRGEKDETDKRNK